MATIRTPRVPAPSPWVRRRLRVKTRKTQRIAAVWPVVALRCAGVAMSIVAGLWIAYEVGRSHKNPHGFWAAVEATIARPPVALAAGGVLVIALAACLRRILFEQLVRRPGPILVGDLGVPSGIVGVDAARLSAIFRQRLQQLRLRAPAPLPGAMPEEGFLEMLDGNRLNADNVLGSAVRLLRAAVPSHAYEVSATLVKGPRDQPAGSAIASPSCSPDARSPISGATPRRGQNGTSSGFVCARASSRTSRRC